MPPSVVRRRLLGAILAVQIGSAHAQAVSKSEAIALAEAYIARNGYTNLPRERIGETLDSESLELGSDREQRLRLRFNTLMPKAIGIKRGTRGTPDGWSVSFDYVGGGTNAQSCRVVTMNNAGAEVTIQHVDGIRSYFAGFD